MPHGGSRRSLFRGRPGLGAHDRRQSERVVRREPCAYVFNVAQREALMIHEGEGFVRDASAAGLCVLLDRKPEDHGILEVRTAGLESAPWICLVGVCWIRELPTTRKLKWVAGGRCLFGCALN